MTQAGLSIRIIPRLDIKGPNVVKGVHLEGLRVIGDPADLALRYYEQGADELLYMDVVASLYGRNSLLDIVAHAAKDIFIPLTVGGGIRTLEDIRGLLRAGADKVSINTQATKNPDFIREAARSFGSQCIVISIEAKRRGPGQWEALTDNGREKTGLEALPWALKAVELGAGELLVTSVDQEGTAKGYDLELTRLISQAVSVPVIACGGAGEVADVRRAAVEGRADAISLAHLLHYGKATIGDLKAELAAAGLPVRAKDATELNAASHR